MYPIPANATRIRYLESTGTQYIDSGVGGDQNSAVEIGLQALSTAKGRGIFGAYGSNSSIYLYMSGSYNVWQYGFGEYADTNVGFDTSFHVFRIAEFSLTIDGAVVHTLAQRNFTTAKHLMLFRTIESGGSFYNTVPIRLHYARFYQSGTLVRSFVPVRIGSTGCLFDRVTGQFFYNQGTGSFVCGEDDFSIFSHAVKHVEVVSSRPYDAEVEYIESTGTQYMDTGVAVSAPSTIAIEADEDVTQPLGFTHQNVTTGTWISRYSPSSATGNLYIYYKDYRNRVIASATETRKIARWDGSSGYYENGSSMTSFVASVGSDSIASRNWLYGAVWDFNDSAVDFRSSRAGKIYGLKVRVSGILVRDFVPVRVGTEYCLYDRANPTGGDNGDGLYHNKGTGAFLGGIDKPNDGTKFLTSRAMGDSSGTMKAVRKHYDMPMQYTIDECNGNAPTGVNVYFPSGTYEDLDYTPTWSGHRFVGWYTTSATPSTTAPTSGTQVQKGDSVVFDRSTVYARWQLPTTVTFDATTNGGQMPSGWVSPDYYEGHPYGTLPEPTKFGEVFLGWFTSGGTRVTESSTVTSGTLTARYAAVTWGTTYSCTTTSSYKNTGIYSANRYSSSDPIVIDWGDGTTDVVYGNISQLAHTYSSVGTFTVKVSDNISTFCPSYSDTTWRQTTSQNQYTFKKVLTLSSKVTQLSQYAFYYCSAMTDAIIPSVATSIPNYCFYYCSQLKSSSVQLPSTVTSIGSYAFYNCTSSNFNSITIPAACTSIGSYGFGYCYYLHPAFESGSSTLVLNTYAFAYCFYQSAAVGTIDLSPRKITSIPNYCFYYCRYLKGITWPQGVTSIGGYAFRYCFYYASSTGTIEIPEGVTTISSTYAFANCLYLTAVTLPSTLTNLNNYTFYYCTRLATITSNRSTAPTVSAATFGNSSTYYTGRTSYSAGTNRLYVPSGATGYNASYWSSVLLDSTKCGFTLVEVEPPGIYVEFNNVTSSSAGLTNYTDTLRFDLTPTVNTMNWSVWLRDGQTLPNDPSEFSGISICDPDTGGNLVMLWNGTNDFASITGIDTSSPTVNPYNVGSGTITIRKVES